MSRKSELDAEVKAIMAWWRLLYPDETTKRRGDAGARASMRRAENPFQALLMPACQDLLRLMRDRDVAPARFSDAQLRRIAMAAAVICECRDDGTGPKSLCESLGQAPEGGQPRLSLLRFQALMGVMDRADGAEQMTALRRAMAHVRGTPFNVNRLVRDLLDFSDATRIAWTFDYYGTRREPSADQDSDTEENQS